MNLSRKYNIPKKFNNPKKHTNLPDLFYGACDRYQKHVAIRQIVDKKREESITYAQLADVTVSLGAALVELGLKDKHIALIGENSIQWLTAYFAIVCGTGVAVPLDKELDIETLALQINMCDAEAVFVSGKCTDRYSEITKMCPKVRHWILMRSETAANEHHEFVKMEDLIADVLQFEYEKVRAFRSIPVDPESCCDIIFTSGTTGANKGVMLSHKNICTVVYAAACHITVPEKSFATLPVNHSYEKNCNVLVVISMGKTLCINDDLMHMAQNIARYKPQVSVMVPMMLDTLRHRIVGDTKKHGLNRHFEYGIKYSNLIRKIGIDKRAYLFKPILERFGGEFNQIITGGAALNEETRRFFDSIGITIVNGYGISECAPLVSANFTSYQRPGSVGRVIPGCEVKIVDPDEKGDGTIFVRGDNVMMGYYKDPENTAKTITEDGWLNTGDIGHIDRGKFLYISGRIKNLIILSNGKNVCPEELEDMLCKKIEYIKEVVVYADDKGLGIYANCYLDKDYLAQNGITDPYDRLKKDVALFNKVMPSYKRISDVNVSDKAFPKTTTQKIQRFKVEKIHQHA